MLNLDPAKLMVILVVALIVLGPERLPRVARQLGGAWRELTRVRNELTEEVRAAMPDVDLPKIPYRSGALASFLRDPSTAPRNGAPAEEPVRTGEPRAAAVGQRVFDERVLPDDPSMN